MSETYSLCVYKEDGKHTGGDGLGLEGREGEGGRRGKAVTRGACLSCWPRFRALLLACHVIAPLLLHLPFSVCLRISVSISLRILSSSVASFSHGTRAFRPSGL